MDKNVYEALKEEDPPDISFTLESIGENTLNKISANGNLKIAGVTQAITLDITTPLFPLK